MSEPAEALYDAAVQVLEVASQSLAAYAPAGPIAYQAIWPGLPAFDCAPALHVSLGGVAFADTYPLQPPLQPMQRLVTTGVVDIMTFTITVLRCCPTVETQGQTPMLPSAAEINQAAWESYGDLWAIWNGLKTAHHDGLLFQSPSKRREFNFDPALPIRTSGGICGWVLQLRAQIPGFTATVAGPTVTP